MAVLSREQAASGEASAREWTDVFSSRWMLAVILLLAFAAYAPTLNDWFNGDDFWFLSSAQSQPLGDYTLKVFDYRETGTLPELNRYRPLYPLVWRLEYEVFGLDAFYYHAVVVATHLASTVLAWFVFRRLLDRAWLSNLATLIFALHPMYVDAIAWISGNRVFEGLPYIAALLLYMKYRDDGERWRWPWYLGSVLLYITAILMHSSAITLAAVLPLYAFFVDGQPRDALHWRAWIPFAPFVLVAAGATLVQMEVRDQIGVERAFLFGWHQFMNYGWSSGMLVAPVGTIEAGQRWDAIIEKVQLIGATAVIFLGFALMYRRPMWGIGVFAWSWFLLALLPDSTFVVPKQGRTLYVAGFAGALLLVTMMLYVRDLLPDQTRRRAVAAAPYVLVASIVPLIWFTSSRAHGVTELASEYEAFAQVLQRDGPDVPSGGTLYVAGAPRQGDAFTPASHQIALIQLYYDDDVNVQLVTPGEPPALGPDDRLFRYGQ